MPGVGTQSFDLYGISIRVDPDIPPHLVDRLLGRTVPASDIGSRSKSVDTAPPGT